MASATRTAMDEAFRRAIGRPFDMDADGDVALWSAAWETAIRVSLSARLEAKPAKPAGRADAPTSYRGYQALIHETIPDLDPRLVEAFMRLEYSTLDHLSRCAFDEAALIAAECVRADPVAAERLAQSIL